jgi:hypothetical protein
MNTNILKNHLNSNFWYKFNSQLRFRMLFPKLSSVINYSPPFWSFREMSIKIECLTFGVCSPDYCCQKRSSPFFKPQPQKYITWFPASNKFHFYRRTHDLTALRVSNFFWSGMWTSIRVLNQRRSLIACTFLFGQDRPFNWHSRRRGSSRRWRLFVWVNRALDWRDVACLRACSAHDKFVCGFNSWWSALSRPSPLGHRKFF